MIEEMTYNEWHNEFEPTIKGLYNRIGCEYAGRMTYFEFSFGLYMETYHSRGLEKNWSFF